MSARLESVALVCVVLLAAAACTTPTAAPGTGPDAGALAGTPSGTVDQAAPVSGNLAADAPVTAALGAGATNATTTTGAVGAITGTEAITQPAGAAVEPTATSIPEPLDALTRTLVYTDPTLGYSFSYPAAWTLVANQGSIVMLTSFSLDEPGRGGIRPGDSKIDFVPDLGGLETTLDEMAAQVRGQTSVLGEEDWSLPGDVPAKRLHLRGPTGDEMAMVLTVIGGRGLRVQGYGDLDLFDAVLRTLHAAN